MGKVKQFLGFVVPGILRPLRILWNEMIGFLFLCLGIIPIPQAIRAWREYGAGNETLFRPLLTVSFCAVMLYFGASSFLRARKISRS